MMFGTILQKIRASVRGLTACEYAAMAAGIVVMAAVLWLLTLIGRAEEAKNSWAAEEIAEEIIETREEKAEILKEAEEKVILKEENFILEEKKDFTEDNLPKARQWTYDEINQDWRYK